MKKIILIILLLPINAFGDWKYLACSSYQFSNRFIAINNESMMTSSFVTNLDDLTNERFDKLAKYRVEEMGGDVLYWRRGFFISRWNFYLN